MDGDSFASVASWQVNQSFRVIAMFYIDNARNHRTRRGMVQVRNARLSGSGGLQFVDDREGFRSF